MLKLGVIGGGVMAEAIISRLLEQNLYSADSIIVSEPSEIRCQYWRDKYAVSTTKNNQDVVNNSEQFLLAIKPQIFSTVVSNLTLTSTHKPLILSILAGVSLAKLKDGFPDFPIVRVMPNTPAMVGQGMTAIAPNQMVSASQLDMAMTIFKSIGSVIEINESLMDAVTGLSGSGPAFVAIMIESLADGGVASGLPRSMALELAIQTVLGTAELIKQKNLHPAILKDQVSSPGGTTIAGVKALEEKGFRSSVISAVTSAYKRSQELE